MKEKTWRCLMAINPDHDLSEEELTALYEYTQLALSYYIQFTRSLQMSFQTTTLLLPKGKVLSKEVAVVIAKEYPSGWGYAVASTEETGIEVARGLGDVNPDLLVQLSEANEDNTLLLWMCKSDQPIQESDLQPFWLIDEEIVACLQGNFSSWEQAGTSTPHTCEYHAYEKRIKPKMIKLWKSNDSDAVKFKEAMEDTEDDTLEQMEEFCPENASVVYMTAQGLTYAASKPEDREIERPWGYEYAAPTQTVEKPAEDPNPNNKKKVFSLAGGTPAAKTEDKPADSKTTELSGRFKDVRSSTIKVGKDDFPFALAKQQDGVNDIPTEGTDLLIGPPKDRDSKDKLEAWYKENLGYRPSNWKARPWIKPKGSTSTAKLGDLQASTAAAALQTAAANKDTTPKHVPAPKVMQRNVAETLLRVELPKILGNNSEILGNPELIMKNEEKDISAAAMMNDKRFIGIKDFDMPHVGRSHLLSHIGGPASESYIALISAIWRDNMFARHKLSKQVEEMTARIKTLETERDEALNMAVKKEETVKAPETKKKVFSLK